MRLSPPECGGTMTECELLRRMEARLAEARQKHPDWRGGWHCALSILKMELAELEHAMDFESPARVKDEALDVAAVALRIVAGEADIKGD